MAAADYSFLAGLTEDQLLALRNSTSDFTLIHHIGITLGQPQYYPPEVFVKKYLSWKWQVDQFLLEALQDTDGQGWDQEWLNAWVDRNTHPNHLPVYVDIEELHDHLTRSLVPESTQQPND